MKIIRTSTVPMSLNTFCKGLLKELSDEGNEVVAISSPDAELKEIGDREGIRTVGVRMQRHISPLQDLKSLFQMIKVFRKEKPDMVHSITPKAGLISMMAAKFCGVPVRIHTFTGLVFPTATGITKKIIIITDKITSACATHVIPEGEGVKRDLRRFKITKKPLEVLGYGNVRGIDLEHYDPSSPEVIQKAEAIRKKGVFTFIFIGRLVRDKGINELVSAFSRLNVELPDTRLLLVGPWENDLDPLRPETVSEIFRNPAIEAVGLQKDVRPWLHASDALVFPSYREGFPNVVIEAGAMGLPSLVTDINGSNEIIVEGENGIIIPPQDEDALYWGMKSLIEDKGKTAEMASKARPLVASRFEQSFVRECLKAFYKKSCESRRLKD